MIIVDTSVWIEFFRGNEIPQVLKLQQLIGVVPLGVGDVVLVEVLQGCVDERDYRLTKKMFSTLPLVICGGEDIAINSADNYRYLRTRGVTVRKTIDTLIATRCIVNDFELLHNDRDFEPFEKYLGLRCVKCS